MKNKVRCKKCNSFDIVEIQTTALDGRPEFQCNSCKTQWTSGKSGEPYKSYCDSRKIR
jgi:transposase-like protein